MNHLVGLSNDQSRAYRGENCRDHGEKNGDVIRLGFEELLVDGAIFNFSSWLYRHRFYFGFFLFYVTDNGPIDEINDPIGIFFS